MKILANRIVVSLIVIVVLAFVWEFYAKPVTGPLYIAAVREYKAENYSRSLELLDTAYLIDPNDTTILTLMGWSYHKIGRFSDAQQKFDRALWLDPESQDARLGLAHSWVEVGDGEQALQLFNQLPPDYQDSPDVRVGMARAHRMKGENQAALKLLAQVRWQDPENTLAAKELRLLIGSEDLDVLTAWQLGPSPRPSQMVVAARLREGYFEVPDNQEWKRFYVAGVNIGPATPGHFASEPQTAVETYLKWLDEIGALGANTIRAYTLLPPAFYRALLLYNSRHSDAPLYLLQEIWLKDPPDGNLFDEVFTEDFEQEIRNVVDAIHGRGDLPIQPGHAGGIFAADVSPYVLGWLVGREIEPRVVIITNYRNRDKKSFAGRYLSIAEGNATEVWLTQRCNAVVEYEAEEYNWQRPVAFVNWPPLDPLFHPTETPLVEERRIRRSLGELIVPAVAGIPDDDDMVSLDEEKISPQAEFLAGYFAVYHLYPFYPDFITFDPVYRRAQDREGLNSYWGYLTDLKKHFQKTPFLVGEYGISTSIGIAHFNPNGWNHGGLEEEQQGEVLVRLTQNIHDAGFAGGLVFEWLDEWWKHNWIANDFEQPFERNALWHNDMDPEQFFGLQKFVPSAPPDFRDIYWAPVAAPGGDGAAAFPRIDRVAVATDPSALYLTLHLDMPKETAIEWEEVNYLLALNTCGGPCGSRSLPQPGLRSLRYESGFNFLVEIQGPGRTQLLVARNYNPYRPLPVRGLPELVDISHVAGQGTGVSDTSEFEEIIVQVNRRRYGRDGTFFPADRYSRSLLTYGVFEPESPEYNSLGQWYYDPDKQELRLRLSWGLLLVMDPSSGFVYWAIDGDGKPAGIHSDQIGLAAFAYRPSPSPSADPQVVPERNLSGSLAPMAISWPEWDRLSTTQVPKKSYFMLRPEFERLTGRTQEGR